MADTKITALTAISTVDPAIDVLPIVDVSDTTMAASGTTKKITSNQILGAGGTATLASATITGDLTVDTSTLKVDSANNYVGIGTASPVQSLTVSGEASLRVGDLFYWNAYYNAGFKARAAGYAAYISEDGSGDFTIANTASSAASAGSSLSFLVRNRITNAGVCTWENVGGVAGTAMTLNSTGLGVGASPVVPLHIYSGGTGTTDFGNVVATFRTGASGRAVALQFSDTSNIANIGMLSGALQFAAGGSTKQMTLDTSGNLGVGVTPSAWGGFGNLQLATSGSTVVSGYDQSLGVNYFSHSSGAYKYTVNGNAVKQGMFNGQFVWSVAPSGTAGNVITWTNAMTLDASGNLLVGTTSLISGTAAGSINIAGANSQQIVIRNTGATAGAFWRQAVDSSNTFYVLNNASTGVSITSGATSWSAVSDERLKDIIEPISNAIAKVGSLRSVIGKYKNDETNTRRSFLIAQDVLSVLPEAVDSSKSNELGLRYSEVIPLLVAAIKELSAEVNALKNA